MRWGLLPSPFNHAMHVFRTPFGSLHGSPEAAFGLPHLAVVDGYLSGTDGVAVGQRERGLVQGAYANLAVGQPDFLADKEQR